MTQKSARIVLSVLFILALACPAVIAELVLHFDANTQEGKDDAWMNSAGPGGAVPMADDKPALEEGMIDVAGQSSTANTILPRHHGNRSLILTASPPTIFQPFFLKTTLWVSW